MSDFTFEYNDLRTNKLFNPARVYWLQPETNMLYRDLLVYRGAAAATIKPVHVITTDFQHRFFDRMTAHEEPFTSQASSKP